MKIRQKTTCDTCRARKLGCDGKLPACSQCLFSKRKCPGYPQNTIFKQYEPSPKKFSRCPVRKKTRASLGRLIEAPTKTQIPSSISVVTLPLEACSALIIAKYAPWLSGNSTLATPPFQICGSWVVLLPELLRQGRLGAVLPSAVVTLALTIRNHDYSRGLGTSACAKAHCVALSLLRKSLMNAEGRCRVELIAASMCLSLAESTMSTSKEGCMAHLMGVAGGLELSGPQIYSTGTPHQLFMGLRPLIIFESFQSRKPCFLAREEWLTIPFLIYPATPTQQILNHAAKIPTLMERFDNLDADPVAVWQLRFDFDQILEQFSEWESSFVSNIEGPPYWIETTQNVSSSSKLGESLGFPNLFVATSFTLLWALQIICIIHCEQLELKFSDIASKMPSAQTGKESAFHLATWICKSMEYLLEVDGRAYGLVSTMFPLRVAYMVFKKETIRNKEFLNWCDKIIDRFTFKGVDLNSLL